VSYFLYIYYRLIIVQYIATIIGENRQVAYDTRLRKLVNDGWFMNFFYHDFMNDDGMMDFVSRNFSGRSRR